MTHDPPPETAGVRARTALLSLLLAVSPLALGVTSACDQYRTAALVRSVPTAAPRPVDLALMEWAIETGVVKSHWVIREHKQYRYVAELNDRAHEVTVTIKYGTTGFAVDYLSSDKLFYARTDDGHETIHKKYATWVKNLSASIQNQLASQNAPPGPGFRGPPPPRAAPPEPGAPYDAAGPVTGPAPSSPAPKAPAAGDQRQKPSGK
jgi:hypothetical protein